MNVHIVRVLSFVALSMITNMALAADDATLSAIDTKATAAKSKADGNNSRIQGLENDLATEVVQRVIADIDLKQQIATVELTPGPQGPMGLPGPAGTNAPDRTAGLCALYGQLSDSGMLGDLLIPDYCFAVCPCADIYDRAIDFYTLQGGILAEPWTQCDLNEHQVGDSSSSHATLQLGLGLVSTTGDGSCHARVSDSTREPPSLFFESARPIFGPEHAACTTLQDAITSSSGCLDD